MKSRSLAPGKNDLLTLTKKKQSKPSRAAEKKVVAVKKTEETKVEEMKAVVDFSLATKKTASY